MFIAVEPLYSEVLSLITIFFNSRNRKNIRQYEKKLRYKLNEPRYNKDILPVPWSFVISRLHCIKFY